MLIFLQQQTDYEVPEIHCPQNIELNALPGEDFNRANWAPPKYTTGDAADAGVVCDYQPGSQFEIGSNMVECTITNEFGISSTCTFFVNVKGRLQYDAHFWSLDEHSFTRQGKTLISSVRFLADFGGYGSM